MPANNSYSSDDFLSEEGIQLTPEELRQRKAVGNYRRNCIQFLEYRNVNPNPENTQEYRRLENEVKKSRDNLYFIEPSLSEIYPDKNKFPIINDNNITLPDLNNIMMRAMRRSYEKAGYKDKNNQELNVDSVVNEVTIPILQLDKNGKPVFDDEGDIQFANQTFFTLKGNDFNEVKHSFQTLLNSVSEKAENNISQIREEVETLSSLIPESHDEYSDSSFKQGNKELAPDLVVSLEKFFGKDLKELSSTNIQAEMLKALEGSTGQKSIKKTLSVINYEDNVNHYIDKVIEGNQGQPGFGYFLQDNVNYVNNGKIEKTVGVNAFRNHLYSEISKNLSERIDLANKNGNTQDLALFENTFGNNPMANEMFNQILSESADSTMRSLSKFNTHVPQEVFSPRVLPNLAPPAPVEVSFHQRMTDPNTFSDYLNSEKTMNNILGYNNNPAPQLDGYGRPVQPQSPYNQPYQTLPQEQPQLPSNPERTVDNLIQDIPYAQSTPRPNDNIQTPKVPRIDVEGIIL